MSILGYYDVKPISKDCYHRSTHIGCYCFISPTEFGLGKYTFSFKCPTAKKSKGLRSGE